MPLLLSYNISKWISTFTMHIKFTDKQTLQARSGVPCNLFNKTSPNLMLSLVMGLLLLASTLVQGLHDHSHHDSLGGIVSCDYCASYPSTDAAVSSHSLHVPHQFIDVAIVRFVDLLVVINPGFSQQSRAPPSFFLSAS